MRKRRRKRGTWFPNVGTAGLENDPDDDDSGRWFQLICNNGVSTTVVSDLTFDKPFEDELDSDNQTGRSLSDIIGSEYILRRIVGKVFCHRDQFSSAAETLAVLVTCGFFVARSEDTSTETAGDPKPIGANTLTELRENYSPAAVSTVREPWIWRRRWILGNQRLTANQTIVVSSGVAAFPPTNAGYGSVMDGPHLDAKTIRRVGQDDRLWFVVSARQLSANWADPFNSDASTPVGVGVHLDYRLFGSLRKAKQQGRF